MPIRYFITAMLVASLAFSRPDADQSASACTGFSRPRSGSDGIQWSYRLCELDSDSTSLQIRFRNARATSLSFTYRIRIGDSVSCNERQPPAREGHVRLPASSASTWPYVEVHFSARDPPRIAVVCIANVNSTRKAPT